jgi:peptidyl-prolyl cis-trans isomerase A (cyclophilin A)/peptidyl-prolyl cis-trans isomerase B (cyclophilin B)
MKRLLHYLVLPLLAVGLALPAASESSLPNPQVVIETTQGNITLRLFRDKAPATV